MSATLQSAGHVTRHQAYRDLAGSVCPCGGVKLRNVPFCGPCHFKLPKPLQADLFDPRADYVTAYERALEQLHLESPAAREDIQGKTAIQHGVQAVIRETQTQTHQTK